CYARIAQRSGSSGLQPFRQMVLGPRARGIRSDRAVTGSQDQGAFLVYIQSAPIIEHESLLRPDCAGDIQLYPWLSSADAEVAFFCQAHLFFVIAGKEIAKTK